MARMSIDDKVLRDPRVLRLAATLRKELGGDVARWPAFARRYALGALLEVWAVSYDRTEDVLEPQDIDTTFDPPNEAGDELLPGFLFSDMLVRVGLAELTPDGARIRGAAHRIRYAKDATSTALSEAGRKGGIASGMARSARSLPKPSRSPNEAPTRRGFGDIHQTPESNHAKSVENEPVIRKDDNTRSKRLNTSSSSSSSSSVSSSGSSSKKRGAPGGDAVIPAPEISAEAVELATLLMACVTTNHPSSKLARTAHVKRAEDARRWADDVRKLHELDHIPYAEIRRVLEWSQRDSFWRANILSGRGLRDKFDRLVAASSRHTQGVQGGSAGTSPSGRAVGRAEAYDNLDHSKAPWEL